LLSHFWEPYSEGAVWVGADRQALGYTCRSASGGPAPWTRIMAAPQRALSGTSSEQLRMRATQYADLLNSMLTSGSDTTPLEVYAGKVLVGSGWTVIQDPQTGVWQVRREVPDQSHLTATFSEGTTMRSSRRARLRALDFIRRYAEGLSDNALADAVKATSRTGIVNQAEGDAILEDLARPEPPTKEELEALDAGRGNGPGDRGDKRGDAEAIKSRTAGPAPAPLRQYSESAQPGRETAILMQTPEGRQILRNQGYRVPFKGPDG
jgi:hypothetical protein